jgi:hypothetical protein
MPLRQWTCDGGCRVFVDQSARQGTYNDGIGVGLGIVEAKSIYYYDVGISIGKNVRNDASNAMEVCRSHGKEIRVWQQRRCGCDNCAGKARARG